MGSKTRETPSKKSPGVGRVSTRNKTFDVAEVRSVPESKSYTRYRRLVKPASWKRVLPVIYRIRASI